ncbi:IPT/TIG domain-containing protein [Micromonospora sp. LOL_023]|uniref:IPT/TIG domain-containing protein n=1 Tax=Micromonospora sp. LOL_023 TaxID=3345418 RepID=UPI003A862299
MPGPDLIVPDGFTYLAAQPTPTTTGVDPGGGPADGFTYRSGSTPRIDSVNPGEGSTAGGTTMTVSGANFIPEQTRVTICGQIVGPSLVTVSGAFNVLTSPTPECDAGTATISVTTAAGTSNEVTFQYVGDGPPGTEPPGTEPPRTEPPRTEPPRTEPPRTEPPRTEPPDTRLPVTGQASGQLAVGGALAVLLGAVLRLMAGRRSQRR